MFTHGPSLPTGLSGIIKPRLRGVDIQMAATPPSDNPVSPNLAILRTPKPKPKPKLSPSLFLINTMESYILALYLIRLMYIVSEPRSNRRRVQCMNNERNIAFANESDSLQQWLQTVHEDALSGLHFRNPPAGVVIGAA